MVKKLCYEELEQRVKELGSQVAEKKLAKEALKENKEIYCYLQGSPLDPFDLKGIIMAAMNIADHEQSENIVHNLSQMLIQAHERERQMISCELHDNIAQNLCWLKMSCETFFEGQSDVPSESIEKMNQISKLVKQTIIAVRDLSYDLRLPVINEISLATAIEKYCEEFSEKNGLKIDFQLAGMHQFNLDDDTKIHLYRLIQEGLNNIRKHADADHVLIKLIGAPPNITLFIKDNGKGFDVRERELALNMNKEKRMGLRSMKERVNLLGGEITIQSRLMKGTKIFITFPFKE